MPFTTYFLLFRSRLLALLMASTALASSCQSSRASFSFQAAPHQATHVPARSLTTATTDSVAASAVAAPTPPVALPTVRAQVRRQGPRVRRARTIANRPTAFIQTLAGHPAPPRPWLHRPKATAEAGLGTTVLGVLGLVLLPVALVGLALSSGGLVWGIVAGAAALAVLVAYLDPFGG